MSERVREVGLLLRIQTMRFAGVNSLIHGKDRKQRLRALGVFALCLLIAGLAAAYSAMFAVAMAQMRVMQAVAQVYALVIAAITVGAVMLKGPTLIFGGDDVPMLRALPVRTGSIVVSRLIGVLLPEMALALLVALPAAIACACCGMPGAQAARLAAALCLIPAIPTAVALAAGVAASYVTRRMRHRSLIAAVMSVLLVAGILVASTWLGFSAGTGSLTEAAMLVMLGRVGDLLAGLYPPADWAAGAVRGDAGSWARLILTALAALVLLAAFAIAAFTRVSDALSSGVPHRGTDVRASRRAPAFAALFRKEWMRFVSCGVYMMNCGMGFVMLLIGGAALCVVDAKLYLSLLRFVPELRGQAMALLPLIPAILVGITPSTACAISLEGRQMELMRAMPVSMRDWLGAKLAMYLSMALPVTLLACIAAVVRLGLVGAEAALMIVYPLCAALLAGVLGLAANLLFPRFDWESEIQVVKQGAAVLVAMLGSVLVQLAAAALSIVSGHGIAVIAVFAAAQLMAAAAGFVWLLRLRMP